MLTSGPIILNLVLGVLANMVWAALVWGGLWIYAHRRPQVATALSVLGYALLCGLISVAGFYLDRSSGATIVDALMTAASFNIFLGFVATVSIADIPRGDWRERPMLAFAISGFLSLVFAIVFAAILLVRDLL